MDRSPMSISAGFFQLLHAAFSNFKFLYKVSLILVLWGLKSLASMAVAHSEGREFHASLLYPTPQEWSPTTQGLVAAAVLLSVTMAVGSLSFFTDKSQPPELPSWTPFLGLAIEYNKNPIEFLLEKYKKHGPVFTFTMAGKKFTFLVGSKAGALFFNSKNDDLNAEEVYQKLVTPVFGKGVAYDVPHSVLLEQKKIMKTGLSIARFREYVHMIENETREYFTRWGDSGEKNLFQAMSELIVLTASRCLHGSAVRAKVTEEVADLYNVLDNGFCFEAWMLPSWLHWIVPKLRARDRAHRQIKELFYSVIRERRASGIEEDDMLQTLLDSPYKDGRKLNDDEVAGMLIGLLMAGQHTSSSTSTWMGFFLAKHKGVQQALYEEMVEVRGEDFAPVTYDSQKEMGLLDRCFKETLRLRPPLYVVMRKSKTPQTVCGYTIPVGHQVCVSPTVNQRLDDVWGEDSKMFRPARFLQEPVIPAEDKFAYVPFGAGRHRCIGESFAYVQNKTIWAVLLEMFEFDLVKGRFPEPNLLAMIHSPLDPIIRYRRRQSIGKE